MTKSLRKILISSGMWKYYRRYIMGRALFIIDKDLPWGGYCGLGEKGPRIVKVKQYMPKECNGCRLLANVLTGSHIAHELGHIVAYYENNRDRSERSAYRIVLEYFENLSKNLKNPPFKLTIINRAKGNWYVNFIHGKRIRKKRLKHCSRRVH